MSLYDSRVICEFLDTVGNVFPMFPEHGMRFRALRYQALGDGICDAAVLTRGEQGRPAEPTRAGVIATQKGKISRSLDVLESEPPNNHVDIGSIAVACALGYLDLRFPADLWRDGHPKLTAWFEAIMANPCLANTVPG